MGAGAGVSRTMNRGFSTDETVSSRPAVNPFDDRCDRTIGLLARLWATEVRSMWLSCASRLLSSR